MECTNFRVCKKNNPFTKEDFNSGDGMLTYVWGPGLWHALHTMSFNYPVKPSKEDKKNYFTYFTSLVNTLPCRYCRENYKKNTSKGSKTHLSMSTMKDRETLSRWLFNLHEKYDKYYTKLHTSSYKHTYKHLYTYIYIFMHLLNKSDDRKNRFPNHSQYIP